MEERIKQSTGKVLLRLRTDKGISQQKFANTCDIDRSYVSRIERGLQSPSLINLHKICNALEIKVSAFMVLVESELKE